MGWKAHSPTRARRASSGKKLCRGSGPAIFQVESRRDSGRFWARSKARTPPRLARLLRKPRPAYRRSSRCCSPCWWGPSSGYCSAPGVTARGDCWGVCSRSPSRSRRAFCSACSPRWRRLGWFSGSSPFRPAGDVERAAGSTSIGGLRSPSAAMRSGPSAIPVSAEEVAISAAGARRETGKMIRFSGEDLDKIRNAVRAAESRTRGEIVPMIVPASARYRDVGYRVGLAAGLLVLTTLITIDSEWMPWGWHAANAGWLLLAVVGAYALGQWAGTFPIVIRLFTPAERMAMKVRLRAEQAFYQHGLHKTRDHTGILIPVSLLE